MSKRFSLESDKFDVPMAIESSDLVEVFRQNKELSAEVERLTKQLATWRGHTEATWKELLDKSEAENARLRGIAEDTCIAYASEKARIKKLERVAEAADGFVSTDSVDESCEKLKDLIEALVALEEK